MSKIVFLLIGLLFSACNTDSDTSVTDSGSEASDSGTDTSVTDSGSEASDGGITQGMMNVAACEEGFSALKITYEECEVELDESLFNCDDYLDIMQDCTNIYNYWSEAVCMINDAGPNTITFPDEAPSCQ